jgi:hypothetical protein
MGGCKSGNPPGVDKPAILQLPKHNRKPLDDALTAVQATMGQSIQLLHQRQRVGTDVRPGLPLFSLLGTRVPESTPLDCESFEETRHPFSTIH